ncbi:KAP family P-loop NTPase fold protein [Robiginitalea biformata]|uniref:KAP NTPase domain-containing protein n=1 Tax=Robiginitalea biformata (strain ATCC BAA-864 / DSM 15991 / KCTC 12146 / HTCC2501) TaxID=313596 RepID=A4CM28_ROBBH|nr:P-loop NTPase fold protein [Robiginitalea biformata]EAR14720.1 hypothetical protein RB2501_10357 [Robiginitalea biformata HTCC2501]
MTYFHSNEPIVRVSEDLYNFSPYAGKIQEAIRKSALSDEPLVFGVYGKWGDGKSTFLNFLFKNLEATSEYNQKRIIKYKFNPWRYSTENKVLLEYFDGLIKVLKHQYDFGNDNSLIRNLKGYAKTVLRGTSFEIEKGFNLGYKYTTKATYDLNKVFNDKNSKSIEEQKSEIDNSLKQFNFRLVVFVDDIDRLNKNEIYNIFRLIKLTASFRNLTYVLSFDHDMVAKAIYSNYGIEINDGYRYIEKIVNIPLKLPLLDSHGIQETLNSGIHNIMLKNQIDIESIDLNPDNHSYDNGISRFRIEIEGIEKFLETPREIVMLLNSFSVSLIALKDEVNYADLLWLELLKLKYPKVYDFLKYNPSLFIPKVFSSSIADNTQSPYKDQLEAFLKENWTIKVKEKERLFEILDKLFPFQKSLQNLLSSKTKDTLNVKSDENLSRIERRINHKEIFGIYFQFNTVGFISLKALEPLYEALSRDTQNNLLDEYLFDLVGNYDKAKLQYEFLDKLKSYNQSQENDKRRLVELLLRNLDKLIVVEDTLDNRKATPKQQLIQDIFENITSFNEDIVLDISQKFIEDLDIINLLYVRRGLYHKNFEGTVIQKLVDNKIIDHLKENYKDEAFFTKFPDFITRSILQIWNRISKEGLELYLKRQIKQTNLIEFIKCFPTWWEGSKGDYLDDFGQKEYEALAKIINPQFIYSKIIKTNSNIVNEVKSNVRGFWNKNSTSDNLDYLKQFMFWYHKLQLNEEF